MRELLLTENQVVELNSTGFEGIVIAMSMDEKNAFVQFNTVMIPVDELTPIDGKEAAPSGLFCSFCSKTQNQVLRLIAGPNAYICNACIALCVEILLDPKPEIPAPQPEVQAQPEPKKKRRVKKQPTQRKAKR